MPAHSHGVQAAGAPDGQLTPVNNLWASGQKGFGNFYTASVLATNVPMNPLAASVTGSSLPHNNMMPYLTLNFCIALQGVFPPRS
jgi:microcystin-dependent protein